MEEGKKHHSHNSNPNHARMKMWLGYSEYERCYYSKKWDLRRDLKVLEAEESLTLRTILFQVQKSWKVSHVYNASLLAWGRGATDAETKVPPAETPELSHICSYVFYPEVGQSYACLDCS